MQNRDENTAAKFLGLTHYAWLILTIVSVILTVGWIFYERMQGNAPFESTRELLAIVIEVLLGGGGYVASKLEEHKRKAEMKLLMDQISNEAELTRQANTSEHERTQITIATEAEKLAERLSSKDRVELPSIKDSDELPSKSAQESLSENDIKILKVLWQYINYDNMRGLFQGYIDNHLNGDYFGNVDEYQAHRSHPKYKLDNTELEDIFHKFDSRLEQVGTKGGNIFGPTNPPTKFYKWNSFTHRISQEEYRDEYKKYKNFIDKTVVPTWNVYLRLIHILKQHGIYNSLENAD